MTRPDAHAVGFRLPPSLALPRSRTGTLGIACASETFAVRLRQHGVITFDTTERLTLDAAAMVTLDTAVMVTLDTTALTALDATAMVNTDSTVIAVLDATATFALDATAIVAFDATALLAASQALAQTPCGKPGTRSNR